jgi:hypothetical protein
MRYITDIVLVGVAILGGIARLLNEYISQGEDRKADSWPKILAAVFVSGFSGYMSGKMVVLINEDAAYVAAGVGAYMGSKVLDLIYVYLQKYLEK